MKKTKKLVMSWLLAFCCVITLVAPSVVNAAADDFEIIDDTDARFVYSDGNANNGGMGIGGSGRRFRYRALEQHGRRDIGHYIQRNKTGALR